MKSELHRGEREDFDRTVAGGGLRRDDFAIVIHELGGAAGGDAFAIVATARDIIVKHGPSGVTRTYEARLGTIWTTDFDRDVAMGLFGVTVNAS